MNEKIKELAIKAGGHSNIKRFRGHILPPPPDYIDPETVDLNKFAEAIVRECISKVDEWEQDSRNHISYMLGEHFGVEK